MSNKTWVIITGGMLGIIAMRLVIGQLLAIVRRYPALVDGAFIIIAWVGDQAADRVPARHGYIHFAVNKWMSFGLIVVDLRDFATSTRGGTGRRRTPRPTTRRTRCFKELTLSLNRGAKPLGQ